MSLQRIAVIFSDRERPETTGVYVRKAFQELLKVDHVQSGEWQSLKGDYDLFVQIDDGYDYVLPETCRPSVFWAIDTHMNLERYLRVGHHYDLVFTAQRMVQNSWLKQGYQLNGYLLPVIRPFIDIMMFRKYVSFVSLGIWYLAREQT